MEEETPLYLNSVGMDGTRTIQVVPVETLRAQRQEIARTRDELVQASNDLWGAFFRRKYD